MSRPIHFVGSVGGATDVSSAMDFMLRQRDHLLWLPDGEPGERSGYVRYVIDNLPAMPGVLIKRHPRRVADWKSLRRRMIWKVAKGHVLRPSELQLGYAANAIASWNVFLEKCDEWGCPGLLFEVGLPSALTLAAVGFGLDKCVKHYTVVREALTREIEEVLAVIPKDRVIFQVEAVIETLLSLLPKWVQHLVFPEELGQMIVEAIGQVHEQGLHGGVHFCFGSLENKAAIHPRTLAPIIHTLNTVVAHWPDNCSLDFIHIPAAFSDRPPSTDPGFYEPLAGLRNIPQHTRLFAGVVQCNSGAHYSEDERTGVQLFERAAHRATGQPPGSVGVSCSCGTGRTEEWMMVGIIDRQMDIALHT